MMDIQCRNLTASNHQAYPWPEAGQPGRQTPILALTANTLVEDRYACLKPAWTASDQAARFVKNSPTHLQAWPPSRHLAAEDRARASVRTRDTLDAAGDWTEHAQYPVR